MDRGVVLLVSGASATLHVPFRFHFAFICMHVPFILHSFPFIHVPFIFLSLESLRNLPSCSFHIPSIFIPMCIHVLSFSSHVHAFPLHFAFVSFQFLFKVMEMALWCLGQGTECNKWLSLRLSLNNSSSVWHCSKEICHKNERERDRKKERKKEKKEKKERTRASWMPHAIW